MDEIDGVCSAVVCGFVRSFVLGSFARFIRLWFGCSMFLEKGSASTSEQLALATPTPIMFEIKFSSGERSYDLAPPFARLSHAIAPFERVIMDFLASPSPLNDALTRDNENPLIFSHAAYTRIPISEGTQNRTSLDAKATSLVMKPVFCNEAFLEKS